MSGSSPIPASTFGQNVLKSMSFCEGPTQRGTKVPRRLPALRSARSGSVEPLERSKIASVSSSIKVGVTAWIFRYSTASDGKIVRHALATTSSSTSSSLDLPQRFSGLVIARNGVCSNASRTCVWATQRAVASAWAELSTTYRRT